MRALLLGLLLPVTALAALGPRYGGELQVGLPEVPTGEAPGVPRTLEQRLVAGLVHDRLLDVEPDGTLRPRLAEGWASAADGREWALRLCPGLSFHYVATVGAADAVRSLRRFLRSDSAAARRLAADLDGGLDFARGRTEGLPGLGADDEGRVVLRYGAALALPLAPLASPAAAITSPRGAGAGPFVPTSRLPGRFSLTAFSGHFRGRPFLDALHLVAAPSTRALPSELQAGRIDAFPHHALGGTPSATLLLALDPDRPPFKDLAARQAVSRALDLQGLVQNFWPEAEAARGLLVPDLLPALPHPAEGSPLTLEGAVTLRVGADVPPLVSQRVVAHLQVLGLEVAAAAVPPGEVWGGRAHARLLLWSPEVAEPGLALQELAARGAGPQVTRLLAEAWEAREGGRRRDLLMTAEAALRSHGVVQPLAWVPVAWRARDGVQSLRVERDGRPVLEDAWRSP
jgi:peptide/nickel transport system substrate-binding protein